MTWQTIVALVVVIPVLLIPVSLVWYINAEGFVREWKVARVKAVAHTARKTIRVEQN